MAQELVERVKGILLTPKAEWDKIDNEAAEPQSVITGYVLPLVALAAIATLIGISVVGVNVLGVSYRAPFFGALTGAVVQIAFGVASVFVFAFIINALAPSFGAAKNWVRLSGRRLRANRSVGRGHAGDHSNACVLGIVGGLYSLYLLFVGLPKLMKPPAENATTYTIVSIVAAIIASNNAWRHRTACSCPSPGSAHSAPTTPPHRKWSVAPTHWKKPVRAAISARSWMRRPACSAATPMRRWLRLRACAHWRRQSLQALARQSLDVESLNAPFKMVNDDGALTRMMAVIRVGAISNRSH